MIVVKHEGVDIQYDEFNNRWKVDDTKNGITFSRQSLEEARKRVAVALKNKGKGRFARFNAWTKGNYGSREYVLVTVTSLVEVGSTYHNRDEAWVTYPKVLDRKPHREKVLCCYLYKDTVKNKERIAKMNLLDAEARKLSDRARTIESKLDVMVVKEEKKDDNFGDACGRG